MSRQDVTTRERLIDAAGEIFSAVGFRAATVREICERAGANVAAINYHFRDKEQLYEAVIRSVHSYTVEHYPLLGPETERGTPAENLYRFIETFLLRTLDANRPSWHGRLMAREMVEPTAQLDFLVEECIKPEFLRLRQIVGELLKLSPEDERAHLCASSIIGQCLLHHNRKAMFTRLYPKATLNRGVYRYSCKAYLLLLARGA